ncbi:unnamed protein product [Arctia plantaginis]|uniref:Uncharacterized protein n=1 Tax=Arctia plantaginis TaxID=874455 RepID=A0A8S1B250_ARCPL|nr:unnamed protein product [Arctia plantaginis]
MRSSMRGSGGGARSARASRGSTRFTQQRGAGQGFGDGSGRTSQCQGCRGADHNYDTCRFRSYVCRRCKRTDTFAGRARSTQHSGYPLRYLGEDSNEDEN